MNIDSYFLPFYAYLYTILHLEVTFHILIPYQSIENIFLLFSAPCFPLYQSEVAQSCPTLCDPMDCSLPGSSVHGIFWARVLEWVALAFSVRRDLQGVSIFPCLKVSFEYLMVSAWVSEMCLGYPVVSMLQCLGSPERQMTHVFKTCKFSLPVT